MAGYREFQTGEVLTAGTVNSFLMEQATMTFADAAARDAALAGVLREGLLTYNLDTNRLEVYDGTDWVEPAPEPPAGIGSNVVQTVKTNTFTSTSLTFDTVTGLSATITPSSASSKVLVLVQLSVGLVNGQHAGAFQVTRGDTEIYRGDADGTKIRSVFGGFFSADASIYTTSQSIVYLDSPETASATTYNVKGRVSFSGATLKVNGSPGGTDANATVGASSVTLIEVAA